MQLTRQKMWEKLGEKPVDLLIIGGGINGAGIARDAALRGLSVALVEARDLAYGTSSRSSKLVHGGLRYLEQFEFSLVFESVSERRVLMDIAPHLVHPLGFLFPVYRGSKRNLTLIKTGLWVYEGLSLFRSPRRHRRLRPADVKKEEPALTLENLKGAPLYYDCSTDDARLTLESAIDAADHGAIIATWAKASSFLRDPETGRLTGAIVEDTLGDGGTKEVRARVVINATGPWTDRTRGLDKGDNPPLLRPTKGIHIVVDRDILPVEHAVVCFHPVDDRVLFAIPWGDRTYVGTTDTDFQGDPGQVYADADDVQYLIEAARQYFPNHPITSGDIIATWAGLRPLIAPQGEGLSESEVSREHQLLVDSDGLITIAGGKLTTYRKMSAEVVDRAVDLLRLTGDLPKNLGESKTQFRPLPGARGWPDDENDSTVFRILKKRTIESSGDRLDKDIAKHLVFTYGVRAPDLAALIAEDPELGQRFYPDRPEILAQINWGINQEFATTVTDFLLQRTQIFYRAKDQGLKAAEIVAAHMAKLLDWDEATTKAQIERYAHDVALSRKWREATE